MSRMRARAQGPSIGLIVEGHTEYEAIPQMLSRMGIRCAHLSCLRGQPAELPAKAFVERCLLKHVRAQLITNADIVVVVVDAEQRAESAADFRRQLQQELNRQLRARHTWSAPERVEVVVCNRTFENWLLADPQGLRKSKLVTRDLSAAVSCHADGKDALTLLKSAFAKCKSYNKRLHGLQLARCVRLDDARVHLCSESLREFVALLRSSRASGR